LRIGCYVLSASGDGRDPLIQFIILQQPADRAFAFSDALGNLRIVSGKTRARRCELHIVVDVVD
jgi:hypothetical protein